MAMLPRKPDKPPAVEIVLGRVIHPSTVEVPEARCHAGADHGNARPRGVLGELCGPCLCATVTLIERFTRHGQEA
jgi:hypothetical protein